ncbi:MAG: TVP38/TMEM64 family protein [Anaerolineae bacterium]|nr:TVP38/TMEM64 family protein [Anaerolineae bacterium]
MGILIAGIGVAWVALAPFLGDRAWVTAFVRRWGVWAPLASIALNSLQVIIAPIPGQIFGPLNGYLFGPLWGTLYSIIGVQLGSLLVMAATRQFGRPLAQRFVSPAVLTRYDRLTRRWGLPLILLIFLFPLLPDDVTCFAAGLTAIPLRRLFILTLLARIPGVAAAVLLGDRLTSIPLWLSAPIVIALGMGGFWVWRNHRDIEAWILWRFRRWFR